jgi:hypothetical protein
MWTLYLTNAFQSSITANLTPYVTSGFEQHSLLTVISIVSNSMAAAVYIPTAKLLDLWGRAEGFAVMVCFATLGLVLMAVCNSLATFCAAQVFYTIGFGGMTYCIDVITADASSLRHRGLAFAFTSSPYIITAFAGPKAAEGFYQNINWRWGFGTFAIILPFVAAPLFAILKINLRKARHEGVLVHEPSQRTLLQSILFHIREFDGKPTSSYSSVLITDAFHSTRRLPLSLRSRNLPAPLHPRRFRPRRLVNRLHNCHARHRLCPVDFVWSPRAIHSLHTLPTVHLAHQPLCSRCLSSLLHLSNQLLRMEFVLYIFPASCDASDHCRSRIRCFDFRRSFWGPAIIHWSSH